MNNIFLCDSSNKNGNMRAALQQKQGNSMSHRIAVGLLLLLTFAYRMDAKSEIIIKEDFSVDSEEWVAIRRGGLKAPNSVLNIIEIGEGANKGRALNIKGLKGSAAVGVAIPFPNIVLDKPGKKVRLKVNIRPNRVDGFGGIAGNSIFFGLLNYSGSNPKQADDHGYYAIFRKNTQPIIVSDFDASVSFFSSGRKQYKGADKTAFDAGQWIPAEMKIERTASGIFVECNVDGISFFAEYEQEGEPIQEIFSSAVFAQGGGDDAPADFDISDVVIEFTN